jgi:hypothetical protein
LCDRFGRFAPEINAPDEFGMTWPQAGQNRVRTTAQVACNLLKWRHLAMARVDEGLSIGFLSPRFDRALPHIVNQGMSENTVEPGHCILTTPQRGLTFYSSENTMLKEILRNVVIPNSFPQKR